MQKNIDFGTRILLATVVSVMVLVFWGHFIVDTKTDTNLNDKVQDKIGLLDKPLEPRGVLMDQLNSSDSHMLAVDKRIQVSAPKVYGSISSTGLIFDSIYLSDYNANNDNDDKVHLLRPLNNGIGREVLFMWKSDDGSVHVPSIASVWHVDGDNLSLGNDIVFTWSSDQNVLFRVVVSVDDNYMFMIKQSIENKSNIPIKLRSYGIVHGDPSEGSNTAMVREGLIAMINNSLEDISYKKILKGKTEHISGNLSWIGISDRYWAVLAIPDNSLQYDIDLKQVGGMSTTEFISNEFIIQAGATKELNNKLFIGAKELSILDHYSKEYNITSLNRVIDFGYLYFLTKPMYMTLHILYRFIKDFGIAIIICTILMRLLISKSTGKSFLTMSKMASVKPEMTRAKELYGEDKVSYGKAVMEIYKKHNIKPMAGFSSMLLQVPIFISFYKVLQITIDMRHAPFLNLIGDLSLPDKTSILHLFGLLSYKLPNFLHIGIIPILLGITMWLQQKVGHSKDTASSKMAINMSIIMVFIFSRFSRGLLIYWISSSVFAICHQYLLSKRVEASSGIKYVSTT